MAVRLTPLGKLVVGTLKWVGVPVVAALIGLKIIGPMIAGSNSSTPKAVEHKIVAPPTSATGKKFQEIRAAGAHN